MSVGKRRKSKSQLLRAFANSNLPFLEMLDDLQGHMMDNASIFSAERPDEHPDDALFDQLTAEFPGWVMLARGHGMFP